MKRSFVFLWAAWAAGSLATSTVLAQQPRLLAPPTAPPPSTTQTESAEPLKTQTTSPGLASYFEDSYSDWQQPVGACAAPACGCDVSCACEPSCGCGNGYACGNGCCDPCSGNGGWGCLGDCCLGDAWTLQSWLHPCCDSPTYGGWFSMGYYNKNERLSFERGDELSFNDVPHRLNLDQAWFYLEKAAEADCCSADWGYRFDIMYGTQAHTAQSFGNPGGHWDASWDHGVYGWAIPQLYGEVAFGDWSVIMGHWFTPVGYEVVAATGGFFYTHTLTHYNSEPFTHTGVLGTYSGYDDATIYTGWALGWDTGFDQFDGGNIFVGGLTYEVSDDVSLTYMVTAGNLGWKSNGASGFSHHFVGVFNLSENWEYVLQHDYLTTDDGTDIFIGVLPLEIDDKGVSNYLFYTLNDCWKVGTRFEWWKSNQVTRENTSFYNATAGVNYRPHANLVFRPEIRYDWTPAEDNVQLFTGDNYNQWSFSMDAVLTY